MHPTQDLSSQNASTQDVSTQDFSTQNASTQNASTQDVSSKDVGTRELGAPTGYETAVLPDQPWPAPAPTPAPSKKGPDVVALVAAVVFCLIALAGLIGTSLPGWVFGGGLIAVLLVLGGAALLVTELRRSRR